MFRTLWRYRELILNLVKRDLKTRYRGSALGFLWSLCKPLFIMAILFIVFTVIVPLRFNFAYFTIDDNPAATSRGFGVHLIIGILLWNFFATALSESTYSILANGHLIRKIRLPVEVFPVATVLSNLVHYLLALAVLIPAIWLLGYKLTWMLVFLPILIVMLSVMVAGFAFFLSATNVFYRDIGSITEIALMGWFYITPIIYPASVAFERLEQHGRLPFLVFMANPVATISVLIRRVIFIEGNYANTEIADASIWKWIILYLAVSSAIYAIGRLTFQRLKNRFSDEV